MGFVLAISAQCYKSKCREVKFCCIKVIRDVEGEEELDIQRPKKPNFSECTLRTQKREKISENCIPNKISS